MSTFHVPTFHVIDHGEDHDQYFPGQGLAWTDYKGVATGQGRTYGEAYREAIEALADSIPDDAFDGVSESASSAMWDLVDSVLCPPEMIDDQITPDEEWPHEEWSRFVSVMWK